MHDAGEPGALFFLPEILSRQRRPVAGLINAGHLARAAAQRAAGGGWISISRRSGWWDAERTMHEGGVPAGPVSSTPTAPRSSRLRQTLKDARRIAWNLSSRPAPPVAPVFVWQRLDPFFRAGVVLARRFRAPLVVSVHSLTVVERRKWGSGALPLDPLLARGDRWVLDRADCICPVSAALLPELEALGIAPDDPRLLVTPNQVDTELFRPRPREGRDRRRELGIGADELVVGWAGSFRSFHRLDLVLEIDRLLSARGSVRPRFLFVGEGAERRRLEEACAAAGVRAVFTGAVEHAVVPEYLSAMNVGLVLGSEERGRYHYSPVKLRELLACGVPAVCSDVGEVRSLLAGSQLARLLAGSAEDLAEAIEWLAGDAESRAELGRAARRLATSEEGWDGQLRRILDRVV